MPVLMDQLGPADFFDGCDFVIGEFELGGGEVVLELVCFSSADDGGRYAGAAGGPGKGRLSGGYAMGIANFDKRFDDVEGQ